MRQLSRIFMTISALCFAVPAFAQGGTGATQEARRQVRPAALDLPRPVVVAVDRAAGKYPDPRH